MAIEAVVFDIGSVLETVDYSAWPGGWDSRLGLEPSIRSINEILSAG